MAENNPTRKPLSAVQTAVTTVILAPLMLIGFLAGLVFAPIRVGFHHGTSAMDEAALGSDD